jgi:hypothetical protein
MGDGESMGGEERSRWFPKECCLEVVERDGALPSGK